MVLYSNTIQTKIMKEVIQRASTQPPLFFRRLRNIGVALAGISTAILTAPITLPATLIAIAGYAAVAGGVIGAVSQLVKKEEVE
jgi:uncharacterized membrane protein HdeD (DUF308 family)